MNRLHVFISFSLALIFVASCRKENIISNYESPAEVETLSWDRIRTDYSMPERFGMVFDLHLDNEDNIWLNSLYLNNGWVSGLWKYDGEQWNYERAFENYNTENRDIIILGEIVFRGNDMWFGFMNQLVKFDGVNFEEYPYPKKIEADNDLKVLHFDRIKDEFWVVAGNQVAIFKNNEWSEKFELPDEKHMFKYDLLLDNDTSWLAAVDHLFQHYNGITIEYTEVEASLGNNEYETVRIRRPFNIAMDNKSRLFVPTYNGLLIREHGKWSLINDKNSVMQKTIVTTVACDKNNVVWVGTYDGFYKLDENNTLVRIPVPLQNYCSPCDEDQVLGITVDSKNRKIIRSSSSIFLTLQD